MVSVLLRCEVNHGMQRTCIDHGTLGPRGDITALRAAFQMLAQGDGTFQDRAKRLGDETDSDYVQHIVDFVTASSDRSFLTPGE